MSRAIAVPFTPAETILLTQVKLPLNYFSGANAGTVQIVNTANGGLVPGTTVLASLAVSNVPAYPSATLTTLNANPVFLYGGVQYWLVVSATNDTLLWWWGNVFGLSGPETALAGLWSPATGTLPAFSVIGTAAVPDPNASGCSGTNPEICWPSPQQNPNGFKYGYNVIDSGASDIYIPLIDPNATSACPDWARSRRGGRKPALRFRPTGPAPAWCRAISRMPIRRAVTWWSRRSLL